MIRLNPLETSSDDSLWFIHNHDVIDLARFVNGYIESREDILIQLSHSTRYKLVAALDEEGEELVDLRDTDLTDLTELLEPVKVRFCMLAYETVSVHDTTDSATSTPSGR